MAGQRGDDRDRSSLTAPWQSFLDYSTDFWQRNALFWDVMRQRGNQYLEHAAKPVQHVLEFDFDVIIDGRELDRPVNYGLVRIVPPDDVQIDDTKRPFVIVDPRAGHGPGIGGFKRTSEVGAVLHAGHPCYFIGFLAEPIKGQTLEDVGRAELSFIRHVAERHPKSGGKPCVIGNCQAGWAMIMMAAYAPEDVGPLLIAGAPLSYWAGVRGKNPMRYTGGLLGGTWLTSLTSDLGNGIFDGAYLVQNMENLKPAHTLWSKQYNLWSRIDTEASRYLDFERWWGGHVLLTGEEMQFITDELFVGNKLVQGEIQTSDGVVIDPRNIRSPIVVFCSHGDNITPPQQALDWVLDLYEDVDEIRAHEQTIVYALHHDIGHLGIFVSGRVGKKEHDQFTQTMDLIDILPPGLYEAVIREKTEADDNAELAYGNYIVSFEARTLEDIRALGDEGAEDDQAFEAVARLSEINQGLYRQFVSPAIRSMVTEQSARWLREMHPSRLQYTAFSDRNPFMAWTKAAAENARASRATVADDNPCLAMERRMSDAIVAWLDGWQDLRDRAFERIFFAIYGSEFLQTLVGLKSNRAEQRRKTASRDPAHAALIREKIGGLRENMGVGGSREAAARALAYVGMSGHRVDERAFGALKRLHQQLPSDQRLSIDAFKLIMRDQFFMLLLDEEEALNSLSALLPDDSKVREDLFEKILSVTTASGPLSEAHQARLQRLAQAFGLDGKRARISAVPKVSTKGKSAPTKRGTKRKPASRKRSVRSPAINAHSTSKQRSPS